MQCLTSCFLVMVTAFSTFFLYQEAFSTCWHASAFISWVAAIYDMQFLLTMSINLEEYALCIALEFGVLSIWSLLTCMICCNFFGSVWIFGTQLPCTQVTIKCNYLWLQLGMARQSYWHWNTWFFIFVVHFVYQDPSRPLTVQVYP